VVNDRGVRQIYIPVVWKIKVPPPIHIFLWLFVKNKLLTRNNLAKRKNLDDQTCLFCAEPESISHLFSDCCVARQILLNVAEMINLPVGQDFESIAKRWLSDKKFKLVNICTSAVFLWTVWKARNDILFQVVSWTGMSRLMAGCAGSIRNWEMLLNQEDAGRLELWAEELEMRSGRPPRIVGPPLQRGTSSSVNLAIGEGEMRHNLNVCNRIGSAFDAVELEPLMRVPELRALHGGAWSRVARAAWVHPCRWGFDPVPRRSIVKEFQRKLGPGALKS
jgi:hypothetical protein